MLTALLTVTTCSLAKPQRLLEITTRPYLYGLQQKYGSQIKTIRDIPNTEFEDWKNKGFDWVWFMGIWTLGNMGLQHDLTEPSLIQSYNTVLPGWTKDDVIGSPYCIVTYSINPTIGSEEDLKWLKQKLHSYGIKLMVDFVPNHSACDAPQLASNPNFYVRSPKNQAIDPKRFMSNGIAFGCGMWCDPWTDVAQFNYMDNEFRAHQISVLKYIETIADGCRCDMAHLVLNDVFWDYWNRELTSYGYSKLSTEFWKDAISTIKGINSDFLFMAESYGDTLGNLISCGFDYAYDKEQLDQLYYHDISKFKQLLWDSDLNHKQHLAHFTENHDEPRAVAKFWNWPPAADAAAVALFTLPGLRFVNQDQWLGYSKKIDVHLRRAVSESPNQDVNSFYNKIFKVLSMSALTDGTWTQLSPSGSTNLISWKWVNGAEHILVTINFGEGESSGSIVLDDAPMTGSTIPVTELLSETVYTRNPQELRSSGLYVVLSESYQVQIFKY